MPGECFHVCPCKIVDPIFQRDDITRFDSETRTIGLATVHNHMAMCHHLSRRPDCSYETSSPNDIVEPAFEQTQQHLASVATLATGLGDVSAELLLKNAVVVPKLLFLHEANAIVAAPSPAETVWSGRIELPPRGVLRDIRDRHADAAGEFHFGTEIASHGCEICPLKSGGRGARSVVNGGLEQESGQSSSLTWEKASDNEKGVMPPLGGGRCMPQVRRGVPPIGLGGIGSGTGIMKATTVDYWTCIDLASALDQTMCNGLWSTAERIAETARRIGNPPAELIAALHRLDIREAATDAATELAEAPLIQFPQRRFARAS